MHQQLIYANDNVLSDNINTMKKDTEALSEDSSETGLEVQIQRIRYTVMFRNQNSIQNHNLLIVMKLF
jgi:hypothetical protein